MGLRDGDFARLLSAHTKKKHDRVPNFEICFDPLILSKIMGWSAENLKRSDMLSPEEQVALAKKTCQDAIICNAQYWPAGPGEICSAEMMENIACHEPDYAKLRQQALACKDAVAHTNLGVGAMLTGSFSTTYWAFGPIPIQSFMYMLHDDIELVKYAMDLQTQRQIEIIKALENTGIGFVEIADDLCDNKGFFVRPDLLEEIWLDNTQKLVQAVKNYLRVPIQFHCCGKIDKLIPYLLNMNIDSLAPIQTNVNDIFQLKKDYNDRLTLVGNLSIDGVLAFGTPDDVVLQTRKLIEIVGKDGGYIVASSHSIVDAIPPENYFAMMETAVTHGIF